MMRGFTLIETIIVIAITSMMMAALSALYVNFNSFYGYQQTLAATANAANSATNAIGAAVLPASHVLASHTFSGDTISSGTDVLVLELPAVNASGDIISGTYDYVAFYLSGTDLFRRIEANAASIRTSETKRVATLVNSIVFTYDSADFAEVTKVTTDITTQLNTQKGLVQTQLQTKSYLRNI